MLVSIFSAQNGNNTGIREYTGEDGKAHFEVLGNFAHKFRARVGGTYHTTGELLGGEDADLNVPLAKVALGGDLEDEPTSEQVAFGLDQNYPNPFNPSVSLDVIAPRLISNF